MNHRLLAIVLCIFSFSISAETPVSTKAPVPLNAQVQRLTELLRDNKAKWYSNATGYKLVELSDKRLVALVVFTIEGFNGGNNFTQYLAAFNVHAADTAKPHYTLVDVLPMGGKGWRIINIDTVKVTQQNANKGLRITFDALEVSGNDGPNFPTKETIVNLIINNGRMREQ